MVFNYFNQRLAKVALEMKLLTDEFIELLEEADEVPAKAKSKGKRSKRADSDADENESKRSKRADSDSEEDDD